MATQIRVLFAILMVTVVAADHSSYSTPDRRRNIYSSQEGQDLMGTESEQESFMHQGLPRDFNPSPQIPDGPRSDSEQQVEIGGLTVQDPPKGWPFSDIALQEKFQEQIQQEETAQRQMWSSPPEQTSKQHRYRQGRLLDGNSKGRKESQSSREEASGEQTYREYPKKKRIVKPSQSQGMRIRQSNKQYHQETNQQEEQPQQFEQQKMQQEQQKFASPEPILHEDLQPRHSKKTSKRRPTSSANTGSSVNVGYSLNFGNQESEKSGFNFGNQEDGKSGFNFGNQESGKSGFNFGNQENGKSSFNFGNQESGKSGFNFGNQESGKSGFNFGNQESGKSGFNFGNQESGKSGFNFGNQESGKSGLNFGNQESGKSGRNPVGVVQSEVVHGEGAVSYSNAQIGSGHLGHRNRPNADTIDGRPIYVPPISSNYNRIPQQNNFQNGPEHELLPNPAALIGEEEIGNYAPEGVSVVKSSSHFEIGQNLDSPQIISQVDHSGQYETKPIKPPTILHINDGSDFKWKNLGNGVEISAPVTLNGLKGGYRESIPIQEDNEEDIPIFDKKPPVFVPPIPPKPIVFNNGLQFEQDPNTIFSGPPGESIEGNFPKGELLPSPQELTSNQVFEEAPPKLPNSIQSAPLPFSRRPNIYNHNFAEPPAKYNEDIPDNLGFPKFPEMNKIYYLPNTKSGEGPIPAVAMPLSVLRQITGSLDSQTSAYLGQDISTAEFMKMLATNDAGPDPPTQFHEHRPKKQRTHGFNPNKGHQNHEGRMTRTHHRYQQNNNFNVGPYGVKVTKSIPIFEQHTVNSQNDASHGPWNAPPKHPQVQHYNIPLEAYESLRPNAGNFKSRPNHNREEGFNAGSGRQQYRHARQNHQQNRDTMPADQHGNQHATDMESFAVSSSYRIGPQAQSGWNKHGRN